MFCSGYVQLHILLSIPYSQAESIQQREALLKEMEVVSVQTARETRSRRDQQTSRADELQAQVSGLSSDAGWFVQSPLLCRWKRRGEGQRE